MSGILKFLFIQLVWWAVLLGMTGITAQNAYATLSSACLVGIAFLYYQVRPLKISSRQNSGLGLYGLLLGLIVDGIMMASNMLKPGPHLESWSPHFQWLILSICLTTLWIIFSASLHSMQNLIRKPSLFILTCAFAGPLSYSAAERSAFFEYAEPRMDSVLIHALLWVLWAFGLTLYKQHRPEALKQRI